MYMMAEFCCLNFDLMSSIKFFMGFPVFAFAQLLFLVLFLVCILLTLHRCTATNTTYLARTATTIDEWRQPRHSLAHTNALLSASGT